jgi:hypothetical protein
VTRPKSAAVKVTHPTAFPPLSLSAVHRGYPDRMKLWLDDIRPVPEATPMLTR